MTDADNSTDWPTLSDSNNASASAAKNKQVDNSKDWPKLEDSSHISSSTNRKKVSKMQPDVTDGAAGLDNTSTSTNSNKTGARRKKQTGKTKWSPVPIDLFSYRDNRNERHESQRFAANGRRFNNNEPSNTVANGHEYPKGRVFRGGRGGRGHMHFRPRRESAANADSRRYQRVPQDAMPVTHIEGTNDISGPVCISDAVKEQVMRQIEYYFSEKNLLKDTYLRCHMDEQGYAQIPLVANFPRIKRLTDDLQLILEAVKRSSHLEVSDDVKVRPVVDPLRWPIKEPIGEATTLNTNEPYVDLIAAQLYNMSIDPSVYQHIPGPKSLLPGDLSWSYIPVDDQCMVNGIYPHVNSSDMGVSTGSPSTSNGDAYSPEQPNSPTLDLPAELASQYVPDDCQIKTGTPFCPLIEIPSHADSSVVSNVADDLNTPNGHACSDHVSLSNMNNELACQHIQNDYQSKSNASFLPVNGIRPPVDSNGISISESNSNIPNGHASCASDVRHVNDLNACNNYFGQMTDSILMYDGGRYSVAPYSEIIANNADSSEDKSTLHNKSPEPSR